MRILFVCLGNICRSPMAEGVFTHLAAERGLSLEFDSAGTGGWHAGEAPDRRMQQTAHGHGIDITGLRARKFERADFDRFDIIYAMDESNQRDILALARSREDQEKVRLILNEVYPGENMSVPDPYYGGQNGFEHVYDLLKRAAENVLSK